MQTQHSETPFSKRQFPLVIVCESLKSPANIGGVFRISDSFGVAKLYFCSTPINIKSNRLERTARATQHYVDFEYTDDTLSLLQQLYDNDYLLIALEITEESTPITEFKFDTYQKIALIVGEESLGIPATILEKTQKTVHIPMYGNNSSMNVVTATGIALYEITKQLS